MMLAEVYNKVMNNMKTKKIKNKAAAMLARSKWKNMTPEQRSEHASMMAKKRWSTKK